MHSGQRASPVRRFAIGTALYFTAVLLGLGSAWWVLKKAPWVIQTVRVGTWETSLLAGSANASIYTRGGIAVTPCWLWAAKKRVFFRLSVR